MISPIIPTPAGLPIQLANMAGIHRGRDECPTRTLEDTEDTQTGVDDTTATQEYLA